MVEVALMLPWFVYLFVGALDFGFCAYAMIATQNAARIAATWGAASSANYSNLSSTTACTYAAPAFTYAPTHVTACGTNLSVSTSTSSLGSAPVPTATVNVTYTVALMALPGLFPSSFAITQSVEMPARF